MNPRERFLATVVLSLLLGVGGGAGYYVFIHKPFSELNARIARAQEEVATRAQELAREKKKNKEVLQLDPRLEHWKQLSLPQARGKDPTEVKKHLDLLYVEYDRYLSDLLRKSDISPQALQIKPQAFEDKNTPKLTGKVPLYGVVKFKVQGLASLKGLIALMEGFYRTPLLHQIKKLQVQRPLTARAGSRQGDLDIDLDIEVLQVNGAEKRESLMPSLSPLAERVAELAARVKRAEKEAEEAVGDFPDGFAGATARELQQLGAKLTDLGRKGKLLLGVEGAEVQLDALLKRYGELEKQYKTMEAAAELAPHLKLAYSKLNKASELKLVVLADGKRNYEDILKNNFFTGKVKGDAKVTEDPKEVLGVLKLAHIQQTKTRWEAYLYNQSKKPDEENEKMLTTSVHNKLSLSDRYDNSLLEAEVVNISSTQCLFFKAKVKDKERYFRMVIGDFLSDTLERPLDVLQEEKKAIYYRDEDGVIYRLGIAQRYSTAPERVIGVNLLGGFGATLPRP
jgi:hypothetical protein